jgi:hypothetical protein
MYRSMTQGLRRPSRTHSLAPIDAKPSSMSAAASNQRYVRALRPARASAPRTRRTGPSTVTAAAWRTMGCPPAAEEKTAARRSPTPPLRAPRVSATATPASTAADRYHRRVTGMRTAAGTIHRVTDQRATRALSPVSFTKAPARSAYSPARPTATAVRRATVGQYVGLKMPSAKLRVVTHSPEVAMKDRMPLMTARLAHAETK